MALIKLNNNSISAVTALPAGVGGSLVKLLTTDISSSVAEVEFAPSGGFTDYKMYAFSFNRIQPDTDNVRWTMHIKDTAYLSSEYGSRSGDGNTTETTYNTLTWDNVGNNTSGSLIWEDFSGLIYCSGFEANRRWKYFGNVSYKDTSSVPRGFDIAGDNNDTDEITAIKFLFSSGNIVSGQITMFGVNT